MDQKFKKKKNFYEKNNKFAFIDLMELKLIG